MYLFMGFYKTKSRMRRRTSARAQKTARLFTAVRRKDFIFQMMPKDFAELK
jgi:hypothetical protein